MHAKTAKQNKAELIVVGIAVVAFLLGVIAHLAGASLANSDTFGYIAAPIPLILGTIFLISYKIAANAED
ncbi:hypothetical protein [Pseudoalteromonas carrageenovora]|uniref:Asparaginyl-tRNA synthetase n=1 Tax=Pseudoalteromonas carrageenovora IAM 12662 TaxID=1314868 RepID=A0A2K4X4X3_PSEVC|nr:hypothetical protein [Pseudoalteromonas carrageenovora]MBE0381458.1 hypothetical protein [Pseudoalteromonas carrageenovora IAM 12662]MDO6465535.1 hypothetical protein [Pseudoalteromonas carrageenovora]MDO6548850.1 hypothetical protein [Pseudoalteromonas carrageenovora]MDO6833298.1 hypothetical protein [Pseudoalteromonas carrageenovora]QBJ70321.1 hypothetical protein PC2016_0070 [Pseudoalteromonas carrageenovora]